jgi:hypothetical protein
MTLLPKEARNGSLFNDPENLNLYLQFYFGAMIFFFLTNFALRFLFEMIGKANYHDKDPVGKQRYLEKWNSNVHHVIIFSCVYYGYTNQDIENPFIFFKDDVAFMTVHPPYVCIEMIYLGYITQNWIELRFMIND